MRFYFSILAFAVAFIVVAALLRKLNERIIAKYGISLAWYAKAAVYSVAAVIVAITLVSFLLRSGPLSTPLGRLAALHWQAGDATPADCRLCPDGFFIIICDADKGSHIGSLRELASLQADYRKNGTIGGDFKGEPYSCIGNQSFRLKRHSGAYGFAYDPESAVPLRQEVWFHVLEDNDTRQIVEVHYHNGMRDIPASLFRYEVRNNTITALESWVLLKYQIAFFLVVSVLALIILLYGGVRALIGMYRSRRRRGGRQAP